MISNSDAHSPVKLGREANILDTEISYRAITNAIKTGKGFTGTVEFFSEEGKYHYDGHRSCGVSLSPEETIRHNYLCPVCGRKVTIGVMHRVEKLSDRQHGFQLPGAPPFHSIIPLQEIIAEIKKIGVNRARRSAANIFDSLKGLAVSSAFSWTSRSMKSSVQIPR